MSTNKRNLNICEIYHFAEDFSDVKATRDSNLTVPAAAAAAAAADEESISDPLIRRGHGGERNLHQRQ